MRSTSNLTPLAIVLAGLVALGVAMGIGRFAFTPLLPMMLAERSVDLPGASLLASANYLGYLVGALACTFQPWIWRRLGLSAAVNGPALVRGGLVATALLTLGMALHMPAAWTLLRFAAGVASAVVFLYTSGFCLEQLARRAVPAMGALIYVGPGLGIVASGLAATALVQMEAPAAAGWLTFGLLAALLTAAVWRVFDASRGIPAPAPAAGGAGQARAHVAAGAGEMGLLTLAYGLAGIGYIITATFLPVIARQALPGSHWLDLFWPLFGTGVMLGALGASRLRPGADLRLRLAGCYVIQAVGVAASLVSPTLAGFAIGSLLLGLPFTAITFFAMQEVRRVRPLQATSFMGLLTASYGLGQIVGPPLAAWLVARSASAAVGFGISLWIASALLVLGAAVYLVIARRYPV
ncbi:YbfB/YjiJ family MFS transporter [Ramlibacter tataouinensis]|uniref:Candidate transporter n=1 Tax=Ramlibacter tataouinensis (strain ATCC BAA-407 / DSM 14655 / LMG 21543 / TTB310) TaxID=365046 RepID=F5XWA2_RAMTT|nr:YbfB/YjiJ family MFS transporter [Ramlibacter tataouinensis]AEG91672.1 Candidate transporter [Ramlibacter tataouinensis TTB310]